MRASETGTTFYYHACANAIGGQIHEPVKHTLPAKGSASLAQAGGEARGTEGPHRIHGILTFDTAHSEVFGSSGSTPERGGAYITTVTSVLENLDVLDGRIKAKQIVANLTVRHPLDGGHPSVSFRGTKFVGLEIDHKEVFPELDLSALARTEVQAGHPNAVAFEQDPELRKVAAEHHGRMTAAENTPSWVKSRYASLAGRPSGGSGIYVCSLVKNVKVEPPNSCFGHIIHVPDVGNLFLGEICVRHRMFEVTMLRLELGCPVRGDVSCCTAVGSGTTMPI